LIIKRDSFGGTELKHTVMKRILLSILIAAAGLFVLQPAHAITGSSGMIVPVSTPVTEPIDPAMNAALIQQFLKLTPQKYYELTGKRMKLSQKISLKLAQWKIKRMMKKGKAVDLVAMTTKKGIDTSDFSIAGFLLGFFLSLIGVLIAYLLDDEAIIKWAWLGAGLSAILWLIFVVI
jgi:hypothetical protein